VQRTGKPSSSPLSMATAIAVPSLIDAAAVDPDEIVS
jgi:hypothetical protein